MIFAVDVFLYIKCYANNLHLSYTEHEPNCITLQYKYKPDAIPLKLS
jgi:hypothetical protein